MAEVDAPVTTLVPDLEVPVDSQRTAENPENMDVQSTVAEIDSVAEGRPLPDIPAETEESSAEVSRADEAPLPTPETAEESADVPLATQESLVEPIYAGYMLYKKTTATFPIFHKRYFFFNDDPVSLSDLKAFYDKHKKLKVDIDELNSLVAHAATTGKGLFFFSKSRDAVPTGIIECARITSIEVDEVVSGKFHIHYSSKQGFAFETNCAEAWVTGIKQKESEHKAELEGIKASEAYAANLKALEDGSAFATVTDRVDANEILSDDEPDVAIHPTIDQRQASGEKQKNRGSMLFAAFKDRLPLEKTKVMAGAEETAQDAGNTLETSPSRNMKRKSFLTALLTRKETVLTQPESATPVASDQDADEIVTEAETAIADTLAALESKPVETPEAESAGSIANTALIGVEKGKEVSFLSRLFKKAEKNVTRGVHDDVMPLNAGTAAGDAEVQLNVAVKDEEIAQDSSEISEITVTGPAAIVEDNVQTIATETQKTADADVTSGETRESPVIAEKKNFGRRLTSLFKSRRISGLLSGDQVTQATVSASPVTESEAPILPETAKVEDAVQKAGSETVQPVLAEDEIFPAPIASENADVEKAV